MIDDRDEDDQREEIGRKRRDEAIATLNEIEQLQWLMEQPVFRDYMWRVLERCHIWAPVWDSNYGKMSFADGERNVGLRMLQELATASPDRFLEMQTKANRARAAEKRSAVEKAAGARRS